MPPTHPPIYRLRKFLYLRNRMEVTLKKMMYASTTSSIHHTRCGS